MTNDEQSAFSAVERFLDNYSKKEVAASLDAFSSSRPIILLGTNEDEVVKSREQLRTALERDFGTMREIHWGEHRNEFVVADDRLATVVVELPASFKSDGREENALFRWDLTLAREGEQWKICAGMVSVPYGADTYSFPPSPA